MHDWKVWFLAIAAAGVFAAPSNATRAVGPPVNRTLPHIRACHVNSKGRTVCKRIA
jgi:hypothetical protein